MKILKMIPVNNKGMKQLSDCGRVSYQFCKLEINGFNFSNNNLQGQGCNQSFGLPQHCCAKWGRWVGDYKKRQFFPESMACTLLQNRVCKNFRKNSVRQGQKIKILISKGGGCILVGWGKGRWCCIMQYNKQYITNLMCFKGFSTHKELIRCIRITARSQPPESRAGVVPVFFCFSFCFVFFVFCFFVFFGGGRGWGFGGGVFFLRDQ